MQFSCKCVSLFRIQLNCIVNNFFFHCVVANTCSSQFNDRSYMRDTCLNRSVLTDVHLQSIAVVACKVQNYFLILIFLSKSFLLLGYLDNSNKFDRYKKVITFSGTSPYVFKKIHLLDRNTKNFKTNVFSIYFKNTKLTRHDKLRKPKHFILISHNVHV